MFDCFLCVSAIFFILYHLVLCLCGRDAVPLGLQCCHFPSGLLRSCSSRLSDAGLQFGCFNCKQGRNSVAYLICSAQFLSCFMRPMNCKWFILRVYLYPEFLFCFQGLQAGTNYCNGHTGQLSTLSVLLSWAGSLGVTSVSLQVLHTNINKAVQLVLHHSNLSLLSSLNEIAPNLFVFL